MSYFQSHLGLISLRCSVPALLRRAPFQSHLGLISLRSSQRAVGSRNLSIPPWSDFFSPTRRRCTLGPALSIPPWSDFFFQAPSRWLVIRTALSIPPWSDFFSFYVNVLCNPYVLRFQSHLGLISFVVGVEWLDFDVELLSICLLYTSPSPRD